eukprot:241771_1
MYLKKTFAFSVALICLALTICVASAAHSGVVYDREDSRHSHLRRGSVPPMQSLLHPPPHWMLATLLMLILPSFICLFVSVFKHSYLLRARTVMYVDGGRHRIVCLQFCHSEENTSVVIVLVVDIYILCHPSFGSFCFQMSTSTSPSTS